jgi:hypothetical protein
MSANVPHAFAGPQLYGLVLRYRLTGQMPLEVAVQDVGLIQRLAKESDVLGWLREHYPGNRLAQYHAVAREICGNVVATDQESDSYTK